MEEKRRIRLLRADEIECRVSTVTEKGISLLLYKDARVDQNILDETFGIMGWQRTHERIGDALFCSIHIRDEDGGWITKQDVGVESFAEPIKGAASDAFKRAAFNVGVGRELYTAPFIWIPIEKVSIKQEKGKNVVKNKFHVSVIQYEEGKAVISGVEIQNEKGEIVYSYGIRKKSDGTKDFISEYQVKQIRKEMERTGVSEAAICQRYKITSIRQMDQGIFERVIEALRKTKGAAA